MQLTQRQLFLSHVAQTSDAPMGLDIARAEGVWLYDQEGKGYIDMISGIAVSNVGHRHPAVLKAIHEQLDKYMHLMVYGEYIQTPQVQLATALSEIVPGDNAVYFVNSGAEAVEGAIKLARRATGRKKLLSFTNAYHGSTNGALSLMSDPYFTTPFKPLLEDVQHLDQSNADFLDQIDESCAAIFVELVRGEAGALAVDSALLESIYARCRATGTLFIADEIQTGFGRTGPFFAFMPLSFVPDIIVMAKGMGGGLPIGAFLARRTLMQHLSMNPVLGHITTFGGNAVTCAASLATMRVIQSLNTEQRVPEVEQLLRARLQHPLIKEITGKGLMLAIDVRTEPLCKAIIRECLQEGVITDWFLFADYKLRLAPPLTITNEEIHTACDRILKAMDRVAAA